MFKRYWQKSIEYMNIEPDPDSATQENYAALRMIMVVSLISCILLMIMQQSLLGHVSYGTIAGVAGILFLLAFCVFNWSDVRSRITIALEVIILLFLIMVAFVEYSLHFETPIYMFLLLLVLLPSMIFDRPWRIVIIILTAAIFALIFNHMIIDDDIQKQNLIRLLSGTLLSLIFSCRTAYRRIIAVKINQMTQDVAEHDPLTGVLNRGGGVMMIRNCIDRQESGTFIIIDIDDFKHVNDNYGHQRGDEVLQRLAHTLRTNFKEKDIVMRMGGDEFIVYAIGMVDYSVTCTRLEQLVDTIHRIPVSEEDKKYLTVSIGAVINDGSYPTYDSLYNAADNYLYRTKMKGKDGYNLLSVSYR